MIVDTLSPIQRSRRMSLVRGKDTGPEMAVRRLIHGMGYRYRLHRSHLPGKPDLVFPARKKLIFVHGCFWHRHWRCGRLPKSRLEYWLPKLENNRKRDIENRKKLKRLDWKILVVWECQIEDPNFAERLARFLEE